MTAWQERHAEEDFLALVRHNAATKLEMEQWPPAAKKRRVGKPSSDEQYTRALCDRVAALVEPPETLPQAKRPGWWRHGMPLFAERGPLPDGAEAVAAVEPAKSKRAYHQPSRDLRLWVVDYVLLRHLQGWDNRMIADHLAAWLPDAIIGREQEGRPRTHSAREVRPCWRGRRPDLRGCDAAHLQTEWQTNMAWHADSASGGSATSSAAPASSTAPRQAGTRRRRTPNWWTRTWTSSDCA